MTDFSASDSTKWLHFSDREGREVVVVDISLGILFEHIVDELDIRWTTERRDREYLCDSSLEEC